MRFSVRFLLIASPLLALIIAGIVVLFRALEYGIDDAYAEWGAAGMVIQYMEEHNGHWPRSWDDLRPYHDAGGGMVGGESFEGYRRRIDIDFGADPNELRHAAVSSHRVTFHVIRATRNTGVHFDGGPNRLLHDYLRSAHKKDEAFPSEETADD